MGLCDGYEVTRVACQQTSLARKVGRMDSGLTLLFLCDQSHLYSSFISEFRAADFQVMVAPSLTHAEAVLQTQSVHCIVLLQDCSRQDRELAVNFKQIAPGVPVFLLTDQQQARPAAVDSIWRWQVGDQTSTRAMAVFFRHLLRADGFSNRPAHAVVGIHSVLAAAKAHKPN